MYRSVYENEVVYGLIGKRGCTAVDVSTAMGGTEAVVESVYSVMKAQNQTGGLKNETLALR